LPKRDQLLEQIPAEQIGVGREAARKETPAPRQSASAWRAIRSPISFATSGSPPNQLSDR
jgi:hypothetical protein